MSQTLLLVEDSDEDEYLVRRSMALLDPKIQICRVKDASAAIAALQHHAPFNDPPFPRPNLIITDLKMPRSDGFELLKWVQESAGFQDIPIVVLSDSYLAADIRRAHSLGADIFVTKPSTFTELTRALKSMLSFYSLYQSMQEDPAPELPPVT